MIAENNWGTTKIDGDEQIRINKGYRARLDSAPIADPWIHRSEGMRCKKCIWFVPKVAAASKQGMLYDIGRCRKHAPTMGGYPVVFVNDWCGDHRIDENKL